MGIGGWNPNLPGAQDYYKRQKEVTGHSPTAGRARSPMPACKSSSRRSKRPARSIARRCSTRSSMAVRGIRSRSDRPQDPHPREAVGRGPVAEGPVRRRLAGRHAWRATGRIPEAELVSNELTIKFDFRKERRPAEAISSLAAACVVCKHVFDRSRFGRRDPGRPLRPDRDWLQSAIWRCPHRQPRLWRISHGRGVRRLLDVHTRRDQSHCRHGAVGSGNLCS